MSLNVQHKNGGSEQRMKKRKWHQINKTERLIVVNNFKREPNFQTKTCPHLWLQTSGMVSIRETLEMHFNSKTDVNSKVKSSEVIRYCKISCACVVV